MTSPITEICNGLVIQENTCFRLNNFGVEVLSYIGQFTADVCHFKVNIYPVKDSTSTAKLGLLRIGSVEGGLSRELKLREALGDYKMIAELLAHTLGSSVLINPRSSNLDQQQEKVENNHEELPRDNANSATDSVEALRDEENCEIVTNYLEASGITETSSDYLEEETYPEKEISSDSSQKLILLTYFPEEGNTLQTWLTRENSLEAVLLLTSQVCQFFRYLSQRQWCFVHLSPQLIQMGTPINFFDLTGAYPSGEQLSSGLLGDYCAPELSSASHPIQETMSTYTLGALLYNSIHQHPPSQNLNFAVEIRPIPQIYQILSIALSPIAEERFPLSQFLSLVLEIRKSFATPKTHWNVASRTTVGLSLSRLQNEDSYGIRQLQFSNSENLILGVVADGMGGMAQGEVASNLAVKTVMESAIPTELKTVEQWTEWLLSLVQMANERIASTVREGGTTLSLVLAIERNLMVAHVGDSRIYLLRQGEIRQLSEDHSLVAMMVASGEITYEESQKHPDRNVLTKSLGSKRRLSDGYVQNLSRLDLGLSLTLEDGDIVLLCSDGVWDLVPKDELPKIFTPEQNLQSAVDETINGVIQRGAPDNATLLALECRILNNK